MPRAVGSSTPVESARPRRTVVASALPPQGNRGIWIPYSGARWYAAGGSVSYEPDRFVAVGEYKGFAVYREKNSKTSDIYVAAVDGGPLTRYRK